MENVKLAGRVALVTGGSRGIGLATAQALARGGARVVLLARKAEPLAEAAAEIGDLALAIEADVSDPGAVRGAFERVARELGRLDILVNNAAIGRLHKIEHATDADILAGVGTNFLGAIYCVREAVPLMRAVGGGEIVNISSEAVLRPFPYLSLYAATKGALETFSSALHQELKPDGIRVTLLRAGATASAGFALEWDPATAEEAFRVWKERGLLDFSDAPMPTSVLANAVLHAVTQPPGAAIGLLDIRPV